jgi:hypothetical protein
MLRLLLRYRFAGVVVGMLTLPSIGPATSSDLSALRADDHGPIAYSGRLAVAEAFAVGARIGDHPVFAVGFNFEKYFYPLVEADAADGAVDGWTLGRSSDDATLIAMIGGEDKVALSLSTIRRLMARGGRGDNHTDGQSNFAYARSPVDGRLWAIHWTLSAAKEWTVGAVFVPHPDLDWAAGARLFVPRTGAEDQRPQHCAARLRLACLARP